MPDDNGYNQVETPVAELVRERYGGEIYESYPLGQQYLVNTIHLPWYTDR